MASLKEGKDVGRLAFCCVSLGCDWQVGAGGGETRGKRPLQANRWGSRLGRMLWKWEEGSGRSGFEDFVGPIPAEGRKGSKEMRTC